MKPPTAEGVQSYTRKWFLDLHNDVNSRQDPPVAPWTEAQVIAEYGGEGARAAKVAAAREALLTLNGIIGGDALQRLLEILNLVAT
jgi:hypothetical protein